MEQMVTISVKVPRGLKERIKKSRVKVSQIVRSLLEQKILEEESRKINEEVKKRKGAFDKLSIEAIVNDLREDRAR
jgi:post-segregation antitoxin (ccd killing protein)